jgi:hypothetical protein
MKNESKEEGIYLYCIVNCGENTDFGEVGLEDRLVYIVPCKGIGAVVHRCYAEPYKTDDEEKAKDWILVHQYVIDMATERFGTVIPLRFDTIFKGDDATVEGWLKEKYDHLKETLQKFKGKDEYGIQVYLEKGYINEMFKNNEEIVALKSSIKGKPKGSAYLLKKRLERAVKLQEDVETHSLTNKLCKRIAGIVNEMRLEQNVRDLPEKWRDKLMILNLSCFVQHDHVKTLGDLLSEINDNPGITVKFTGPWPPYSFVSEVETSVNRQG